MSALAVGRVLVPLLVMGGTIVACALLLRRTFPEAWRRWLGRLVGVTGVVGAVCFAVWQCFRLVDPASSWSRAPILVTTLVFSSALLVAVSATVWAPLATVTRRLPVDERRRAFLGRIGGALPAAAAASGPLGTVAANAAPVLRELDAQSHSVPAALDGFSILHLTDVHLGVFITPAQVAAVVDAVVARGRIPDLVALTGDIADDYAQLPEALAILQRLGARHGVVASIGNHEIYRGRKRAEQIYADAGIPLLSDGGMLLEHGGARVWIAGANDPARGIDGADDFLAATVDRAFAACPADVTCRVLLSHRPRGYVRALHHRATLTLAGHTHGAQIALWGRSVASPVLPDSFLLGRYVRDTDAGACHLYTSAGLGHWMPLRLNCPAEAALVTLRPAQAARSTTA
jgi:predicted MPP superfamily phosphohydrolase